MFNLLEDVVVRQHSADVWDDLLDSIGSSGSYTSLGNYSDEEMVALVGAAAKALNITPAEVLRWFGVHAMPVLAERYPALFTPHTSSRPFVLSVNSIIHPEVRKLYAGASCPFFHFREGENGALLMGYHSPRKMCALAHGFVEGAAAIYNERVDVAHRTCMHHGDEKCLVEIKWLH